MFSKLLKKALKIIDTHNNALQMRRQFCVIFHNWYESSYKALLAKGIDLLKVSYNNPRVIQVYEGTK